ncbi:MAG: hypothetical protein HRU76_11260 [Phycisphaeraceae bacterium]|nr:MAG: hypothetical protein HRU76_11260 [Phycisphaeraceae bacterium]
MMKKKTRATDRSSIGACLASWGLASVVLLSSASGWGQTPPPGADRPRDPVTNRWILDPNDKVVPTFNNVRLTDTIEFIMETTGKAVIPSGNVQSQTVTIMTNQSMSREDALNLLFIALLDKNVGVIETADYIKLELTTQIGTKDCPVIGPDVSVLGRKDDAIIINKIFALRHTNASSVATVLDTFVPDDWGKVEVEADKNTIVVLCTVGTAKKLELMLKDIDSPKPREVRVFFLKYADATALGNRILNFFASDIGAASQASRANVPGGGRPTDPRFPGGNPQQPGRTGGDSQTGGQYPLRVEPDNPSNSITVVADPEKMREIEQMVKAWDIDPLPRGPIIKRYRIRYRDVLTVQNILNRWTGQSTGATGGQARPAVTQGGQPGAAASGSTAIERLSSLYDIQADTGQGEIIAIAKTSVSFELLDVIIEVLDQPGEADAPLYIDLKHADAQEVALEINAAFAERGIRIDLPSRATGLTPFDTSSTIDTSTGTGTGTGGGAGGNQQQNQPTTLPWTQARPDPNVAPESPLIGKVRVMPILRQNAVLVIGPPHYKDKIAEIISQLDRPGRQVLITAVIAEVQLDDSLSLGIKVGPNGSVLGPNQQNQLRGSASITGSRDDFLSKLFQTSVLDVDVDIAAVINALSSVSNLRVLSQPRVFTHDNEQANFFDGQTIQFIESAITDIQSGNLNQTFEDKQVGIAMSARPRITSNRDVDLLVSLELSSLSPSTTAQGGLIVDRRRTETRVILQDRQTVVLSGILRETESDVKRKVPLLGDIPLFGALFTSLDKTKTRSELIAFITPIVVDNPSDSDAVLDPMRQRGEEMKRPLDQQLKQPGSPESVWNQPTSGRAATEEPHSGAADGNR